MKTDTDKFDKAIILCNASEIMHKMLKSIYQKRLIPENWKNHYKDLEELINEIEGNIKECENDGRMPMNNR